MTRASAGPVEAAVMTGRQTAPDVVELDGFTGLDEDTPEYIAAFNAALKRWSTANPGKDPHEEGMRLVGLSDVLRRYNTLRQRLFVEKQARAASEAALQLVETRWQELSTAEAWLAAHHAYVVAVDGARTAIDNWRRHAAVATKVTFVTDGTVHREAAYTRILAAGHPPVEPLPMGFNPDQVAEELLQELEQTHERRLDLAATTLELAHLAEH
ncbi:hypothetical protein [Streptomyces ipomoeae]|uniref:hypothetical protein n=1 Tax=Streptomyces ipomoeae TaxID=103232 RepID=UPI0011470171|nr:hypothetical protein [Streptomyces ipomoeae]TQE33156.1 hypothetical protein Sipo7851_21940 [Streptomyces ipomoeae]